eukprot:1680053-Pyramimonas_sp.AAC.3
MMIFSGRPPTRAEQRQTAREPRCLPVAENARGAAYCVAHPRSPGENARHPSRKRPLADARGAQPT